MLSRSVRFIVGSAIIVLGLQAVAASAMPFAPPPTIPRASASVMPFAPPPTIPRATASVMPFAPPPTIPRLVA
jgi:hypothetical protein